MLHIITVLDFTNGKVKVYKNVNLEGIDAEDWLYENTNLDVSNCQWMAIESNEFEIITNDTRTGERYPTYLL